MFRPYDQGIQGRLEASFEIISQTRARGPGGWDEHCGVQILSSSCRRKRNQSVPSAEPQIFWLGQDLPVCRQLAVPFNYLYERKRAAPIGSYRLVDQPTLAPHLQVARPHWPVKICRRANMKTSRGPKEQQSAGAEPVDHARPVLVTWSDPRAIENLVWHLSDPGGKPI